MPIFTLSFFALAAASWAIGKVVTFALKKGEEIIKGETEEAKIARESKAEHGVSKAAVEKLATNLKQGLGNTTSSLEKDKKALGVLEESLKTQGNVMKDVVKSMQFIDSSVTRQAAIANRMEDTVSNTRKVMKESMADFKVNLKMMNEVETRISQQIDMLETNFKDQLRLGLAEHEAWRVERDIVRFYNDFKMHIAMADEEIAVGGKLKAVEDSPNVQAFIKAMRSPLNGITAELASLRSAHMVLEADPNSSRSQIYAKFQKAAEKRNNGRTEITVSALKAELKSAFEALTSSYTMAVLLVCEIAPDVAYQSHFSQIALLDLSTVSDKLGSYLQDDESLKAQLLQA